MKYIDFRKRILRKHYNALNIQVLIFRFAYFQEYVLGYHVIETEIISKPVLYCTKTDYQAVFL